MGELRSFSFSKLVFKKLIVEVRGKKRNIMIKTKFKIVVSSLCVLFGLLGKIRNLMPEVNGNTLMT